MRLFLDARVSARRIATALREQHDVRAADEERELDGSEDERLLALATEQGRIMVTFNVKDFARITWGFFERSQQLGELVEVYGAPHAGLGVRSQPPEGDLQRGFYRHPADVLQKQPLRWLLSLQMRHFRSQQIGA